MDYHSLNAQLNLYAPDGSIQFGADLQATEAYMAEHVEPRRRHFASVAERLAYLVAEGYYEEEVLAQYSPEFLEQIYAEAAAMDFHFSSFLGAFKFHTSYALKSFDGAEYLENFEERTVMVALALAAGDADGALTLMREIVSGRFQPATPTFLNAGKVARGELVSCFLRASKTTWNRSRAVLIRLCGFLSVAAVWR